DDWAICRETAKKLGKSFYLASRALPPKRRQAILAAYAYCRIADDIVDRADEDSISSVERALDDWETQLEQPVHPVAIAFAAARDSYGIHDQPVRDLLLGLRQDLVVQRYATWPELQRYCYLVAGTVGLIVAPILGCRDPKALQHAATLGIAMQLTNILRDVAEDAAMGRVYLPEEELSKFGITTEAILAGNPGPAFPSFMMFQSARARSLYGRSHAGIPSLCPSGRLATLAAAELYSGILVEIERQHYDVFRQRAVTSWRTKSQCVARALTDFTRMTLPVLAGRRRGDSHAELEPGAIQPGEEMPLPLAASSERRAYR
ncbi:MAG: phytoene/squalene synthase family protein, partial [Thermomicrobiales bacterium]